MARTLAALLPHVKDDPTRIIDPGLFNEAAASLEAPNQLELFGPARRRRLLTPLMVVTATIVQALHANTALNDLARKTGIHATASAFCRARKRVPLELFEALATRMAYGLIERVDDVGRWHGWRVFVLDGTSLSMPDTSQNATHFGKPHASGTRRPLFPVAHLLGMVDLHTGMITRLCVHRFNTHDMHACPTMHADLVGPGDLLLADRAFGGLVHLAAVMVQGIDAVFRVTEQGQPGGKTRGRGRQTRMPRLRGAVTLEIVEDRVVTLPLPKRCPGWLDPALFDQLSDKLTFRRVVYTLSAGGYRSRRVCLHTSVRAASGVTAEDLAALYLRRWDIEVHFRAYKRTLGAAVLKGRTPDVVQKEVWGYTMAYNLVRAAAVDASVRRGVPVDRISFTDCWRRLRQALTPAVSLLGGLNDVAVNPINPRHWEPRVRKRSPPNYRLMTRPRSAYFLQPSAETEVEKQAA